MTKKEVKKVAKQSILGGKSKQETFEELNETSKLPTKDLAKIIVGIPSLQAREKYKPLNIILIALLSLTILFKILVGVLFIIVNGITWLPVLFIFPIINILFLIAIATYSHDSHKWLAIFTILALFREIPNMLGEAFGPLTLIDLAIYAGLIGLGFYLNSKFYPNYLTVKERYTDNQGEMRMRNVVKFED